MEFDSDRFAFITRRIHGFATTGNAYDATQTDEAIESGHTLLILSEKVVGIAYTYPFAVTREAGSLHGVKPGAQDSLETFAHSFGISSDSVMAAAQLAAALGYEIDPAISKLLSA